MKEVNAQNCGRENDLISFIYSELNEVEALAFQHHLQECAACSTELTGFGNVRESVVAWRNESLGSIGLPSQITNSSPTGAAQTSPSAMAALREFFNLSPLWMKGAVAFAALLFCVFGGLALSRLRDKPPAPVVAIRAAPADSQPEINALVERRVQEELNRIKNSKEQREVQLTAKNSLQKSPVKRIVNSNNQVVASQSARRPLSKTEREQLAADLRLVSTKSEGDLNLLADTINR